MLHSYPCSFRNNSAKLAGVLWTYPGTLSPINIVNTDFDDNFGWETGDFLVCTTCVYTFAIESVILSAPAPLRFRHCISGWKHGAADHVNDIPHCYARCAKQEALSTVAT
jgi:hypothetical protein